MKRIELVAAHGIKSSYNKKGTSEKLDISAFDTSGRFGNFVCPDMFDALKQLEQKVSENKGTFYITDLFRNWSVQDQLRKDYESGKKKAFAAKPGGSFHMAGRAVDFSVKQLNFENLPKDEHLDLLWSLAKPLGFHPIIKIPDEGASEAWHLDFPGKDWEDAYSKFSYSEVAKCAILDVDNWDPNEDLDKVERMFIQAQLIRLGHYEIGKVDGIVGSKTSKVLGDLGCGGYSQKDQAMYLSKIQK